MAPCMRHSLEAGNSTIASAWQHFARAVHSAARSRGPSSRRPLTQTHKKGIRAHHEQRRQSDHEPRHVHRLHHQPRARTLARTGRFAFEAVHNGRLVLTVMESQARWGPEVVDELRLLTGQCMFRLGLASGDTSKLRVATLLRWRQAASCTLQAWCGERSACLVGFGFSLFSSAASWRFVCFARLSRFEPFLCEPTDRFSA